MASDGIQEIEVTELSRLITSPFSVMSRSSGNKVRLYSEQDPRCRCGFPHMTSRLAPSLHVLCARNFVAMHKLLVVVHILSAMVWLGGASVVIVSLMVYKPI